MYKRNLNSAILNYINSFTIVLFLIVSTSCKQIKNDEFKAREIVLKLKDNATVLKQKQQENIQYFNDSLLKRADYNFANYLKKYELDSCDLITYTSKELKESFEGFKNIGDINNNKIKDFVFVVPPFNFCEQGDSYTFVDSFLPRLTTDSYCCHPDNLFSIGDIDEDGIAEICIFYSSCVSRFKSLIAYSLKEGKWLEIGSCSFDIFIMKPDKEKRIRKTGKGKFEMLEIEIINFDKNPNGNLKWKQFKF